MIEIVWFLWRGIYWSKLLRLEKKIRVALDLALDVFCAKDFVQYLDEKSAVVVAGGSERSHAPDQPGSPPLATTTAKAA